jgi:hypothetical protein
MENLVEKLESINQGRHGVTSVDGVRAAAKWAEMLPRKGARPIEQALANIVESYLGVQTQSNNEELRTMIHLAKALIEQPWLTKTLFFKLEEYFGETLAPLEKEIAEKIEDYLTGSISLPGHYSDERASVTTISEDNKTVQCQSEKQAALEQKATDDCSVCNELPQLTSHQPDDFIRDYNESFKRALENADLETLHDRSDVASVSGMSTTW